MLKRVGSNGLFGPRRTGRTRTEALGGRIQNLPAPRRAMGLAYLGHGSSVAPSAAHLSASASGAPAHRRLSLEEWLGIGEHLRQPWSEETPLMLTETELGQRLGNRPVGFVAALVRAGLLRRQGDQLAPAYLVRSPGLLDIGLKLHDAGLDIETGAEAAALVRHSMRRAAVKLVRHFAKRSGRGFARSRSAGDVGEALTALRPLGAEAVRLVFAQEIERALRAAMEKGAIPAPQTRT